MTSGWMSVAFGCALGAFIGTLSALELGYYSWWLGALFGGIVSYVAIDFRHFCAGIKRSYRKTIAWRPHALYWKAYLASWASMCAMTATALFLLGMMGFVIGLFDKATPQLHHLDTLKSVTYYAFLVVWPLTSLTVGAWLAFAPLGRRSHDTDVEYEKQLQYILVSNLAAAIEINPLGLVYFALKGLWWTLMNSKQLATSVMKGIVMVLFILAAFVAGVFVYVHSQRRTICFVDATIGAAIGYSFGSAIVGAIAGALLGVINYELVSVRWLKLAPASIR